MAAAFHVKNDYWRWATGRARLGGEKKPREGDIAPSSSVAGRVIFFLFLENNNALTTVPTDIVFNGHPPPASSRVPLTRRKYFEFAVRIFVSVLLVFFFFIKIDYCVFFFVCPQHHNVSAYIMK